MDRVKCVNHLNPKHLARVFDQVERKDMLCVMEFQTHWPDLENDLIGSVSAVMEVNTELEMILELEVHHRFVPNSTYEFWERGGRHYLVQLEPWVYK